MMKYAMLNLSPLHVFWGHYLRMIEGNIYVGYGYHIWYKIVGVKKMSLGEVTEKDVIEKIETLITSTVLDAAKFRLKNLMEIEENRELTKKEMVNILTYYILYESPDGGVRSKLSKDYSESGVIETSTGKPPKGMGWSDK